VTEHAVSAESADAGEARYGPLTRSVVRRYGVAVLCALCSLLAARLIVPYANAPVYSLLVGSVAVSVWYGGLGPGFLTLAIDWAVGPFLLVASGAPSGFHSRDDLLRWLVPLAVALLVVWIYFLMRRLQQRAVTAAVAAEESTRQMGSLQELASALSAAVTQADVAQALLARLPTLIGARGGSVGLVDDEEVVIVNPPGVSSPTHQRGLRLGLATQAPIARAAAENTAVVVRTRSEFRERYPEGAAMTPYANAALAVPLRIAGDAVGSMSFLYEHEAEIDEETVAVANIAADLGGQALERALLYERERESRRALDRILRVAPRFHLDTAEDAGAAICREARVTFGSDYAELWRIGDGGLELLRREPEPPEAATAGESDEPPALDELPGLRRAVDELEVTFVSDREAVPSDRLRDHVRRLGVRSWLWAPIVIAGQADRALLVAWHDVVSDPDPSTILLARRFADQAGLALEQIDRRDAEAQAARRAERAQRLQRVTAALSQAVTPAVVSETCLEHAMDALGAEAGLIGFVEGSANEVELVSWRGYTDESVEPHRKLPLDAELPLSLSISSGEPVWALTGESRTRFSSGEGLPFTSEDKGWIAVPLRAGAGVRGAFQLAFRTPREVSEEDRQWLVGLASQCTLAFERSRLFDREQRLRQRSERLQSMTASLSSSVTQVDVANVTVSEIVGAVDATAGALAVVAEEQRQLVRLARVGYETDDTTLWLDVPLDVQTPATRAISRRSPRLYETRDELARLFPDAAAGFARAGHESFLFLPLVVGGRPTGVIAVSWAERTSLSDEDRRFVETLASQAAQALERARRYESERTIAETLQRSVLPVSLPQVDGIQVAARYLPGTAEVDVGGDWFDAITLPNGRVGLVVGDVVGKGVRSAATMAQLRNALRAFALDRTKPASTLARLNRLADGLPESAFATVVYLVVDPETRVCRFSAAGHPPPLAVYPDGTAEYLEGGRGLPLGTVADAAYVQEVVEVPVGTTLILYSDGLIERRGKGIDDGLAELQAAALAGPIDPERLVERVLDELVGGGERRDDIVVLAVRLLVAAPLRLDLRLPRETGSLDVVRDALRVWLERAPLNQAQAGEVVLAAWEACANAVEHAVAPTADTIGFTAELDDGVVRVSVRDTGTWSPVRARGNRGLGLRLMRSLMSFVDIETGPSGTKVALEKEIASPATVASADES
jgi:serine phosphatase RsbU (regulator of sigma subunit)/anti-sigma regulatory factor (Ser/Thr protein kinase)